MSSPHADPLFEALPLPAARVDPGGRLVSLNPAWLRETPWGVDHAGATLDQLTPDLAPLLRSAKSTTNAKRAGDDAARRPIAVEVAEPVAAGPAPAARWWRLTLSPTDGDCLLVAENVTRIHLAETRYQTVMQDQTELICRFLPDTTLTFTNTAYSRALKNLPGSPAPAPTHDSVVGQKFLAFLTPDTHQTVRDRLASLTPDNPKVTYEYHHPRPDGTKQWWSWTDLAFFDRSGRACEFQSVGRDVTDKKLIQDELRARRQETQLILDSIPALVWFKDREGNILRVNKLAADLVGRPPAEIEGRHGREFFPERADQYQVDDEAVFMSGVSRIGIVEPIVDVHGRTRWYRTDKVPLKVEGGAFDRLLSLSIDVTDLVRAEERIRDSESRFRGLFDRVPAAVLEYDLSGPAALVHDLKAAGVTDPETHLMQHPEIVRSANQRVLIRGMNRALLDLFAATDNTQITEVFRRGGLGDELEIGRKMLAALWHGTSSVKFETTGFTRAERPLDLLFRMDVPRDAEHQLDPSRALISLTDLTERTRRIFDQARVEQAAEERRDLGHELHDRLGQQLTGLNMLSATLQRRMAARALPEADDVAELGTLIKEANLEVRRLISGLTPESITAANLTTAMSGLRQNVERTHDVTVTLQSEPPPAELTDEQANHLLMIAGEAAHNAAKHGDPQNIRLALLRDDQGLTLEIADDGRGLNAAAPPEKNPTPHDPRQFSRDHPDPHPGSFPMGGRGMHIMRYRARQIGATIRFISPPGGGTNVRCVLPLRDDVEPSPDASPAAPGTPEYLI